MARYTQKALKEIVERLALVEGGPDFPERVEQSDGSVLTPDMLNDKLKARYRECHELVSANPLLRDYPEAYRVILSLTSKDREALSQVAQVSKGDTYGASDRNLTAIEWITLLVCKYGETTYTDTVYAMRRRSSSAKSTALRVDSLLDPEISIFRRPQYAYRLSKVGSKLAEKLIDVRKQSEASE